MTPYIYGDGFGDAWTNMVHGNPEHPRGIRVIRNRADYDEMRHELDRLLDLDPPRGSADRDRLDVLLVLLADYEAREVAAPEVDPVDAILFRMDQLGLRIAAKIAALLPPQE
jgi:antitoxin component HigA of HigAB toxin-antitoxin module